MSKNQCERICANCNLWNRHEIDYEFPEDECGTCAIDGLMVYGDEEACEEFVASKRTWDY